MPYKERDDWSGDAHSGNDEVHYRLYVSHRDDKPTAICVQWFDYFDYDARRILSPDAYDTEVEAAVALAELSPTIGAVDTMIGTTFNGDLRAIELAAAVRDRIATENTVSADLHPAPRVNYLHVVLTVADVEHIQRGGQVDVDHEAGDGPPIRVAVVYEPKAIRDKSYYI